MPLFTIQNHSLVSVQQKNFATEKELQSMIERNLMEIFNCRLVATEFATGAIHAGRIDTLALSEDDNPVIVEYKKSESSDLINQSLFYLSWLQDHRGDFEMAVHRAAIKSKVDWDDIRVICIAPNFRKYDLHAVQMMGANIELWQYRLFANGNLYLEEVLQKSLPADTGSKSVAGLTAGQKAAMTRATGSYTFDEHLQNKSKAIKELTMDLQEFMRSLDSAIEEVPKKLYIAYKISQNIVCVEVQKSKLLLYVKLDPKSVKPMPAFARDTSRIGHFGTGDFEITIKDQGDLELAKPYIQRAYEAVGG